MQNTDKSLNLLSLKDLNEKQSDEMKIATRKLFKEFKQFNANELYYSLEFGPILIKFMESTYKEFRFDPSKNEYINNDLMQYGKKELKIINIDNLEPHKIGLMEKCAAKLTKDKDMGYAYISTDALPGYKIIPNIKELESEEADLVYIEGYIALIHVLDIHL